MKEEKIEIFGRQYQFITRAQAENLENLRADSFLGKIDANTCERECYNVIFNGESIGPFSNIFGVIKRFQGMDTGSIWIANHSKQTLTYDGIRNIRIAETLKYIGNEEYPFLISREEYENFIKYYSKYFGPYVYRHKGIGVSEQEFQNAQETIRDYNVQLLIQRRNREPKFGDTVRTIGGEIARYIGKNQAAFTQRDSTFYCVKRDLVDMDVDWKKSDDEVLPNDKDLVEFLKNNNWLEK